MRSCKQLKIPGDLAQRGGEGRGRGGRGDSKKGIHTTVC